MKAATLKELKDELSHLHPVQINELCLRLAKFKKENKELLTYLLFEAHNEEAYRKNVKEEMDEQIAAMNLKNNHLAKKTIRKVLRTANKYIRYSGNRETEAELLLYFCELLIHSGISIVRNKVLSNIYNNQLKKVRAAIESMHEDLQYDYHKKLDALEDH